MATLLDQWMPAYTVARRYETMVKAPSARVWQAIRELRPGDLLTVRWLMAARRLTFGRAKPLPLAEALAEAGFLLLDSRENEELVFGVAGRFWTLSSGLVRLPSSSAWRDYQEEGAARSAMSFRLEALAPGQPRLITETRVETFGSRARRRFLLYWSLAGPFSGLIRRALLREVRRRAEDYPPPSAGT